MQHVAFNTLNQMLHSVYIHGGLNLLHAAMLQSV